MTSLKDRGSVAIIIVNYNGFEDTMECISNLKKITYSNYKIFVIDNASSKIPGLETEAYIKQNSEYIRLETNVGFSGGNNVGIQKALEEQFDFILLLNNDTIVSEDFLNILIDKFDSKEKIGLVTCMTYYYSDPTKPWYCGGEFNFETGLCRHYTAQENGNRKSDEDVTFESGCLMLVRQYTIREVGLMSEDYFLYCEDTDYCARLLNAGFRILYTPQVYIYHKVSASTGNKSPLNQYYYVRNSLYVIHQYARNKFKGILSFLEARFKDAVRGRMSLNYILLGIRDYLFNKKGKAEYFD